MRGVCRRIQKARTHQTNESEKGGSLFGTVFCAFPQVSLQAREELPSTLLALIHCALFDSLCIRRATDPFYPVCLRFVFFRFSLSGRLTPSYDCKVRVFQASNKCLLVFSFFFHWSFGALDGIYFIFSWVFSDFLLMVTSLEFWRFGYNGFLDFRLSCSCWAFIEIFPKS